MLGMGWYPDRPGGLNRYFASLFTELRRQGADTRAVVHGPVSSVPDGVVVAVGGSASLLRRIAGFASAARAAARGVDVVDVHFALYAIVPLLAGAWRGRPTVVHFQGPWTAESEAAGQKGRLRLCVKRAIEGAVYRRAMRLVVLSEAFKAILVRDYGVAAERVVVIPPGVDAALFVPGSKADARATLGLVADAWVAVTVRRLVPRMGIDLLLRAWQQVAAGGANRVLLIAGEGPERARLGDLARELGVDGSVRFLGRLGDRELQAAYAAADVTVVPTVALEGYGLVVLESLASGTPVIASDAGGLPEALRGFDASLVFPAGDVEALGARLRAAIDGTLPLPGPERCRGWAESQSWAAAARRHRELYASALQATAAVAA